MADIVPRSSSTDEAGAWFVFSYSSAPYPIALFSTELEACRFALRNGYGSVLFWPFGKEWYEVN